MTEPTKRKRPYICVLCGDRFAHPKTLADGSGHDTNYEPRDWEREASK